MFKKLEKIYQTVMAVLGNVSVIKESNETRFNNLESRLTNLEDRLDWIGKTQMVNNAGLNARLDSIDGKLTNDTVVTTDNEPVNEVSESDVVEVKTDEPKAVKEPKAKKVKNVTKKRAKGFKWTAARHNFCMQLVERGVPYKVIAEALGCDAKVVANHVDKFKRGGSKRLRAVLDVNPTLNTPDVSVSTHGKKDRWPIGEAYDLFNMSKSGLSHSEIADKLGRTTKSIGSKLDKIRKNIDHQLTPDGKLRPFKVTSKAK